MCPFHIPMRCAHRGGDLPRGWGRMCAYPQTMCAVSVPCPGWSVRCPGAPVPCASWRGTCGSMGSRGRDLRIGAGFRTIQIAQLDSVHTRCATPTSPDMAPTICLDATPCPGLAPMCACSIAMRRRPLAARAPGPSLCGTRSLPYPPIGSELPHIPLWTHISSGELCLRWGFA